MIFKPLDVELLSTLNGKEFYKLIEIAGRTCYQSNERITDESAEAFVRGLFKSGHHAMIEHGPSITFRMQINRGVLAEIARHRIASHAAESTRYVRYDKVGVTIIVPYWFSDAARLEMYRNEIDPSDLGRSSIFTNAEVIWINTMLVVEDAYRKLREMGILAEEARGVLPQDLKVEYIWTSNIREIVHFLRLRLAKDAHEDIRIIARMVRDILNKEIPIFMEEFYDKKYD